MTFLPADYKDRKPVGSERYWNKWEKGDNKFRALGSAIVGWEYWVDNKDGGRSPVRVRTEEEVPAEYKTGDKDTDARFFWKFPAWDYGMGLVRILDIKQATVQKALEKLIENKDWGDLTKYDVTVTREGEGFNTEYTTTPSPAKKLPKKIQDKYEALSVNMEALYQGEDPFESSSEDPSDIDDFLTEE